MSAIANLIAPAEQASAAGSPLRLPAAVVTPAEQPDILRTFLQQCDRHRVPAEPAFDRSRRLTQVLCGPVVLPHAARELLRHVAAVAEIAVETKLRSLSLSDAGPALADGSSESTFYAREVQ